MECGAVPCAHMLYNVKNKVEVRKVSKNPDQTHCLLDDLLAENERGQDMFPVL
jgi:hypothetical protein